MLTFFVWHTPELIALRFCFLPHFVLCICLCLVLYYAIRFTSLFTLCFDEIHLIGFYFVTWCVCINSYKNTRGFPRPPTTNSRRRAFARNVDFSFIVSGSEKTFTFRVSFNHYSNTLLAIFRERGKKSPDITMSWLHYWYQNIMFSV